MFGIMFVSFIVLACTDCTSVSNIRTPNGRQGFSIMCKESLVSSMADCYQLAGENCPSGYNVLGNESIDGVFVNKYGGGTTHKTVLTIECK